LIAAVVLSIPLGWKFGPTGVVLSFLLATAFGTLTPILFRYAHLVKESPFQLFTTVWIRGVAAAGVAGLAGWLIVQQLRPGPLAIAAGAAATLAGILPGIALAWFRRPANSGLSRTALVNMLRNF
jgi:O-antigen/teichoic acid export membrane protein